jgi:cell division protein FtsW
MFGVSLLSPRNIWRLASVVILASIVAMFLVMIVGVEIKGAQRWIQLLGFSLQPSEFLKVSFAVVSAWLMAKKKENPSFPGNHIAAGVFLFVISLILLQPDLGMTTVVAAIYGIQIFLAGFPLWLVGGLGFLAAGGLVLAYFIFDHVQSRIDRFLNPESGDSYQVQKSLEAFQNGGLMGTGPGQGTVKLGLPDAHADFIFSVAGEEMGLIFTLFLVAVFAFILLRGFNRITEDDDMFTVLAVGGLLGMFGFQSLIHMGSALHLLPAKGMTLPFISYGGSSILAVSYAMGMVLALTRRRARTSIAKGGAVRKK